MIVVPEIALQRPELDQLHACVRGRRTEVRLALRANIVLLADQGLTNQEIAKRLDTTRPTVALWRSRYRNGGFAALERDAPGRGRPPSILFPEKIAEIVSKTTQEKPPNATQWSIRSMAKAVGVGESSVRKIWREHGLKPHLIETFKVSRDTKFIEKLEDVVGLYLNPPEHAVVFCADEKSQVQALDRTQPGLPLKKGRCETMTHDYKRHGTTTLFAALSMLDGTVISTCMDRHRHQEWIKFLKLIDSSVPSHLDVHLIQDNYSTHKHKKVRRWLKRHPRFHVHFTPTSASWLNMVERFFRDITHNRIRRGVFRSVPELIDAIKGYIDQHNQDPKPFIWTAKASDILAKVVRARAKVFGAAAPPAPIGRRGHQAPAPLSAVPSLAAAG